MSSPGTTIGATVGKGPPLQRPTRWYQFHLLTAVVVMLVAGAWLGLSICFPREGIEDRFVFPDDYEQIRRRGTMMHICYGYGTYDFGFPWRCVHTRDALDLGPAWSKENAIQARPVFDTVPLMLDLAVLVCLLACVFISSEWLIRREARRSGAS